MTQSSETDPLETLAAEAPAAQAPALTTPIRKRFRIRFRKAGDLRLLSHRDMVRWLERMFRRAELKLGMTEGFHVRPRMTFPAPLALGITALEEVMELELSEDITAEEFLRRIADQTSPGFEFLTADALPPGTPKARVRRVEYAIDFPDARTLAVTEGIARLVATTSWVAEREEGRRCDIRPFIEELSLVESDLPNCRKLRFALAVRGEGTARPREILAALGLEDLEPHGHELVRTAVVIDE